VVYKIEPTCYFLIIFSNFIKRDFFTFSELLHTFSRSVTRKAEAYTEKSRSPE